MANNVTSFGSRLTEHHARKLLKEKANHVRLQQHYQFQLLQSKPTNQTAKAHPDLDEKKPPPVPSKPRALKREDVNKLSYCEREAWLKSFGLKTGE